MFRKKQTKEIERLNLSQYQVNLERFKDRKINSQINIIGLKEEDLKYLLHMKPIAKNKIKNIERITGSMASILSSTDDLFDLANQITK